MLSVAVALIGGGAGGRRMHILEDFIKQLIDKERWKVLQKYIFWSMGRFNEKTESLPFIPECFFHWESLTGAALQICVMLYFLKINYFLSENSEPYACILCLQLQDMLDLLGCLLCFLSYFRMIDLSCRLPHLSGPASKELVWQLFFQPFVNDRKWQPWLYPFLSYL